MCGAASADKKTENCARVMRRQAAAALVPCYVICVGSTSHGGRAQVAPGHMTCGRLGMWQGGVTGRQ